MLYRPLIRQTLPFKMEVDTTKAGSPSNTFVMPFYTGGTNPKYRCIIDWGDGNVDTITAGNDPALTHVYNTPGVYEIRIRGIFQHLSFGSVTTDRLKITEIKQWGSNEFRQMDNSFLNCSNLDVTASDTPNVTYAGVFTQIFRGCTSLVNSNGSIGNWKTPNLSRIDGAFFGANQFNQSLNGWNFSNVFDFNFAFENAVAFNNGGVQPNWILKNTGTITMINMFKGTQFNQNLNSLDVSRVTNMSGMFSGATLFNNGGGIQPLTWTTTSLTNITQMFVSATSFNQNVNSWNVSNIASFASVFQGASAFNNGGVALTWTTPTATTFANMFLGASSFNQNVSSFDVDNVTSFASMFQSATAYNNGGQPLLWTINTNPLVNVGMSGLFRGTSFTQDISGWDTSRVNNMGSMFQNTPFNQPINTSGSSWDVSNVTNMYRMFYGNTAFNRDISDWDVSSVANTGAFTGFEEFMLGKSAANYSSTFLDAIYNKWSLLTLQPNINIHFGTIKYTAAGTPGKNILLGAPNNWSITDGGI